MVDGTFLLPVSVAFRVTHPYSTVVTEEPLLHPVHLAGQRVEQVDGDALHEPLLVHVRHSVQQDQHHSLVFEQLEQWLGL